MNPAIVHQMLFDARSRDDKTRQGTETICPILLGETPRSIRVAETIRPVRVLKPD